MSASSYLHRGSQEHSCTLMIAGSERIQTDLNPAVTLTNILKFFEPHFSPYRMKTILISLEFFKDLMTQYS